jgi:hypothetical protein
VFTLVVSLVVVAASVAAVLRLALAEPGQPATGGSSNRRGWWSERLSAHQARVRRRAVARERRQLAARAVAVGDARNAVVSPEALDVDRVGALQRLRSGVELLLLLAFVGTLLAAAIGTLLFMAGLALRNAVS